MRNLGLLVRIFECPIYKNSWISLFDSGFLWILLFCVCSTENPMALC